MNWFHRKILQIREFRAFSFRAKIRTFDLPNGLHTLRYFIQFSYQGGGYHGWQSQPNAQTVQHTLEQAFALILGQPIALTGAGRTDAGVHAAEMVAHFDFEPITHTRQLTHQLNNLLPPDIAVSGIFLMKDDAHARFDAVKRTYQYHIATSKNVFTTNFSWKYTLPLDLGQMNAAANILFEYTDFECFSKVGTDVGTFHCKITEAKWTRQSGELVFTISANRFLRNMVRAIVGTLVNVGSGKIPPEELHNIITGKDRRKAGFSVPAKGLFLTHIDYPYSFHNEG